MEYTFVWIIENYSYCWHKSGEGLESPDFTTEGLECTAWYLELFPRGDPMFEETGHVSLFLNRCEDDGPENISIKYELSILATDGSTLSVKEGDCTFKIRSGQGCLQFAQIDEVLVKRKSEYLPQDTLSVRCKMWSGEGPIQKIELSRARTRIAVRKISFLHLVEGFSALKLNQANTVKVGSHMTSSLFCTDGFCCEEKIMVEITSSIIKFLSKCKLSLIDASGNIIACGPANSRLGVVHNDIVILSLSLTKQVIMARKSEYLPADKFSLLCECIFSPGLESHSIEEVVYEIPTMVGKIVKDHEAAEKVNESSNALEDLKTMYNNQFLTDIELKTKTSSFSAHKIVLCARSPVFKTMLSNDMKEKNCNCIKIEDLEDDILKQLLLFLYCDNLENLQWETAIKLYYAADKYEVKLLKKVCSQYLEDNLNTRNATELLLLADAHSDSGLKQVVEEFILQQGSLLFGSDEWDNLIHTNPQLALRTMLLKYKRLNSVNKMKF